MKTIIHLAEVDSTNEYAKRLIEARESCHLQVIWADVQTKGKGQGINSWESNEDENLTFSLIVKSKQIAAHQAYLNKAISVAVANYISLYTHDVFIKWPNDIYVNNNKIAGILIENFIKGNKLEQVIIGIGININQSQFSTNIPNPISLKLITAAPFSIKKVLQSLLELIKVQVNMFESGYFNEINNQYHKFLYGFNSELNFKTEKETFSANVMGVDEFGRILLKRNNEIIVFNQQEIKTIIINE